VRAYSLARPAQPTQDREEPRDLRDLRDLRDPSDSPTDGREPRPMPVRPLHPRSPEEPVTAESDEPVHVSREPELVRESAESGAEDGAGAAVTVLEPWNGYANMNAREVIARARQAGPAELAAVRLYESRHRSRQTVLSAVDRQLKVGNGFGAA
jgi:hypothetical protein